MRKCAYIVQMCFVEVLKKPSSSEPLADEDDMAPENRAASRAFQNASRNGEVPGIINMCLL